MSLATFLIKFVVITAFTAFVIKFVLLLDLNKKVYNHHSEDGSEDIELLSNGLAVITSGLRFFKVPELENVVGKLYLFDFNKENVRAEELKIVGKNFDKNTLNPHGISSHIDDKGIVTLYVINHGSDHGHSVELFELDAERKTAKHTKTITSHLMYNPNDLVVLGPEEFFVTNDHYFNNPFMQVFEFAFKLNSVVHYDKGRATVADQWLRGPNGIAVDSTKKYLYLATNRQLRVYNLNADRSISKLTDIDLYSHCDNLFYDATSRSVYAGCHAVSHEVLNHLFYPKSTKAPSQVLKITFDAKHSDYTISDTFSNDGTLISASTVAVTYKNQMLIGSLARQLALCID